MIKEQLIKQLKGNYERAKKYRTKHDQRIKFERFYDCFENAKILENKRNKL